MKAVSKVTESELKILKVLWKKKSATSAQIVDNLVDDTEWKPKTIQTLISRLVSKGALKTDKSNKKAYVYYPNITEEEYKRYANKSFLHKVYDGSLKMMLRSFVNQGELSKEEIKDLKQLLDGEE